MVFELRVVAIRWPGRRCCFGIIENFFNKIRLKSVRQTMICGLWCGDVLEYYGRLWCSFFLEIQVDVYVGAFLAERFVLAYGE